MTPTKLQRSETLAIAVREYLKAYTGDYKIAEESKLGAALAAYEATPDEPKQVTYVGMDPPTDRDGDKFQIENLVVIVSRLCALLPPDKQARIAALDYLKRHKLTPSPLRSPGPIHAAIGDPSPVSEPATPDEPENKAEGWLERQRKAYSGWAGTYGSESEIAPQDAHLAGAFWQKELKQHAPTEPATPKEGYQNTMQRHEVIAEQLIAIGWRPSNDAQWHKLKTWLESYDQPLPTPDEKPGPDWIDAVMQTIKHDFHPEILDDYDMDIMRHIMKRYAPQPAAVSANAVTLADVKENIARSREELPVLTEMWNSALRVINAAEADLKKERAAKAQP